MGSGRLTRRRVLVGILALGAVLELVLAIAVFAGGGEDRPMPVALPLHPVAGGFKPDATKLEDCTEQLCFEQAFGNIAYYDGPKAALARFDEQYGEFEDPTCHRVAHAIGSGSLARFKGDVGKTFAAGSSSCFSGYYHGVLERSLSRVRSRNPDALARVARNVCDEVQANEIPWLGFQCLHGLGHGLMITTGYNLSLSLQACDGLETIANMASCNGGAFMENISTSYGVRSNWLRDDDLLYPCNSVAQEDKFKCYELVTSRILRANGWNWEQAAELCANAEKGWATACFRSLGRDISAEALQDPARIRERCATLAGPHNGESGCIVGAAAVMTGNFTSGTQSSRFCDGTSRNLRGSCYFAVGKILGLFTSTAATREADCRALTNAELHVAQCIRGTREYRLGTSS